MMSLFLEYVDWIWNIMTNERLDLNILLVSPLPPPMGGNSVHVQRLFALLLESGYSVKVLDYTRDESVHDTAIILALPRGLVGKVMAIIHIYKNTAKCAIIHFHVSAMDRFRIFAPFLLALFASQTKIMTIHSGSFVKQMDSVSGRIFLRWLLHYFKRIITVNQQQFDYLVTIGIPSHKLKVIPAFIPQKPNRQLVPANILAAQEYSTLILTSGYITPLYNYDILIDCIEKLDSTRYTFIFAFYNESNPIYEKHIYQRLSKFDNVIILRNQSPEVFVSIVEVCDIYVRTTITDGDAVAIRESLYFGKTVFATDCVTRPNGCLIFQQSEPESLMHLFQHRSDVPTLISNTAGANFSKIVQIYKEAASEA
jgi:glycosyltransferase involved in cell wall biosynthesis